VALAGCLIIIASARLLNRCTQQQPDLWHEDRRPESRQRTSSVGIIGAGRTGRAMRPQKSALWGSPSSGMVEDAEQVEWCHLPCRGEDVARFIFWASARSSFVVAAALTPENAGEILSS